MRKPIKKFAALLLIPAVMITAGISGCSIPTTPYVLSVTREESDDVITITYSNGTTQTMTLPAGSGNGQDGQDGKSAYQIWLDNGNTGSETDFLAWLKGTNGSDGKDGTNGNEGKSAYQTWIELGNTGTEAEFIASLKGPNGSDGENGKDGTNGNDGKSAYQIWLDNGNTGSETDFLTWLKGSDGTNGNDGENGKDGANGQDGKDGKSAYQIWLDNGNTGSETDFLNWLKTDTPIATESFETIVGRSLNSVVKFTCYFVERNEANTGYTGAAYAGSGFIYKMEEEYTYLATNYHVLYDEAAQPNQNASYTVDGGITTQTLRQGSTKFSPMIYCRTYGTERSLVLSYAENYVAGTVNNDLALLKVKTADLKKCNPNAKQITFGTETHLAQSVFTVGNSAALGLSVTKGTICLKNDLITLDDIDGKARQYRVDRIDLTMYGGNSGGALFDMEGNVVGVTNAGLGAEFQNINYALPLDLAKNTLDGLYHYGQANLQKLKRLSAGSLLYTNQNSVYVYDEKTGSATIEENIIITVDGSGATAVLKKGDRLTAITINGVKTPITRWFQLRSLFLTVREGDVISFSYVRGDAEEATSAPHTVTAANLAELD